MLPLLNALTIQTAVVVFPVGAHSVLLPHKHHFSNPHLHQPRSLQGTAHTEQLLWTVTRTQEKGQLNVLNESWLHRKQVCNLHTQLERENLKQQRTEQHEALTTMSSSVTRGCRLFTVILVPSRGLKVGWRGAPKHFTIKYIYSSYQHNKPMVVTFIYRQRERSRLNTDPEAYYAAN